MSQLTVRKLDPDLIHRLKVRAAKNRRSAEAEHRMILEAALRQDSGDFWKQAANMRAKTKGRVTSDSTLLIRADRDRDHHEEPSQ